MKNITTIDELKEKILLLEFKQTTDFLLLKEELHTTYEKLRPVNFIKSAFTELTSTPDLKANALNSAIGFTTGLIAKKIFVGMSHSPLTKLLGIVLQMAVTNKVVKNGDEIRSIGEIILKKIINKGSYSKAI
jgi:hypothetical protein